MRRKQLAPHHKAWLQAHPDRTEEWLMRILADGFHIHHVDGNHENNHPDNLKLIEATDHMRLHGIFGLKRPSPEFMREIGRKGAIIANAKRKMNKQRARKAAQARWQ